MTDLTVHIVDSLSAYADEQLDGVTTTSSIFLDRAWLRLIDSLDLEPLVGGPCRLRHVVARRGDEPVAVCPILVTRSASVQIAYSFSKTFFTGWQDEVVRMNPEMARSVGWLGAVASLYQRFTRMSGALPGTFVLAVSPLSYRSGIAVAPLPPEEQRRIRRAMLGAMKDLAREEGAALWFVRVPDEDVALRSSLSEAGFDEIFMLHDNLIEGVDAGLEKYLTRFRPHKRRKLKRDISQARSAGLRFETTARLGDLGEELSRHYTATYGKYGSEHFAHPPSFWAALERHLGPRVQPVLCYQGSKLVRFSVLLCKGDLWAYRDAGTGEDPTGVAYYSTLFYEPLRRAPLLGCSRFWVGPGHWATKHHRGAVGHPLYSYFWFPTRRAGVLLLPYMKLFGRTSRRQLEFATKPSEGVKEDD